MPGEHVATLVAPVYPIQRVIRTVLVDLVVWVPALALMLPVVEEGVRAAGAAGVLPGELVAKVVAVAASAIAATGVVSRIIALPRINGWLTAIGAGTVPRAAARRQVIEVVKGTEEALAVIRGQ